MQLSRTRYWLTFLALFACSFAGLLVMADQTLVRVEIKHSRSDTFKIYWTTENDASWTESKSAKVYMNSRKRYHLLRMPIALNDVVQLRIDPGDHKGVQTQVRALTFYNLYSGKLEFRGKQAFKKFEPIKHVSDLRAGSTLSFTSTGNDPGFLVDFPRNQVAWMPGLMLVQAAILALFLSGLISNFAWLSEELRWVPAAMLLVAVVITAIAIVSKFDTHPDEYVHFRAASYYTSHLVPPEVCDPEARYTYSVYGVSRLDNREIAYYVQGRYLNLVDFVPVQDYLKLRFFNIALFLILTLLAFKHVRARYLFLPLLLTPQAWYLFSYYNSDALSLFAVSLLAYQIFVPQSMLRQLLIGVRPPGYVLWLLGLSLLVAMQYWVKLNYMFYPILLGMLAVSWWLTKHRLPDLRHTAPVWIALALGTAIFLTWEGNRQAINDFELADRVMDCREKISVTRYKPSTPLEDTHYNYRLKAKGVPLSDIFIKRDWAERIFYTGLGAYGYTEYLNQNSHYRIVSVFIMLLLIYLALNIGRYGGAIGRLSLLSTLAALFGITAAAVYINWTMDFQPQGRYLMVYLPIVGTLIAMFWQILNVRWLSALAAVPFLMGLYSMLAVALVELPR